MKMLLAFCIGIFVAFAAVQVIAHLNNYVDPKLQLYLTAAVILLLCLGTIASLTTIISQEQLSKWLNCAIPISSDA